MILKGIVNLKLGVNTTNSASKCVFSAEVDSLL